MPKKSKEFNREKGQSLMFVIVAMMIALAAGLAITAQTIVSLRRTGTTDTSSRVFSAAEGGIEWYLRQPVSVLENLSDGDANGGTECPQGTVQAADNAGACVLTYKPQGNDNIQSKASITVKKFSLNSTEGTLGSYWFTLGTGSVKEVALKDYSSGNYYHGDIALCWNSQDTSQSTALYYLEYNSGGIQDKKIVLPFEISSGALSVTGSTVTADSKMFEYSSCYTLKISQDIDGLRVKTLYAPSKVAVFPTAGGFPVQGFQITSLGQLDNVSDKVRSVKEIKVYRSLPYAPSAFDYSIYSNGSVD